MRSFTSPLTYKVNTEKWTCTCPNWNKARRTFQYGDIRRLCKHLVCVLGGDACFGPFAPILDWHAKERRGIYADTSGPNHTPPMAVLDTGAGQLAIIAQRFFLYRYDDYKTQWISTAFAGQHYAFLPETEDWLDDPLPEPALSVFYGHIYQQPKIDLIVTQERSKSLLGLPKDLLGSTGFSINSISNGGHVATGDANGLQVFCCINPRAVWQGFVHAEFSAQYHLVRQEWLSDPQCHLFKAAAIKWITDEHAACMHVLQSAAAKADY